MVRPVHSWEKSQLLLFFLCLLRYFRVTVFIVLWLSPSQAAICKPRESPEGKRAYFLTLHDKLSHFGQSVNSLQSPLSASRRRVRGSLKVDRALGNVSAARGNISFVAANDALLCFRRQFCSQCLFGEEGDRRLAREAEILLHELSPRAAGLSPQE